MADILQGLKNAWTAHPELTAVIPAERVLLHPPPEGTPVPCIGFTRTRQSTGTHTTTGQHVVVTAEAVAEADNAELLENLADLMRRHLEKWESDRWHVLHMTSCEAAIARPDDRPNMQWRMEITMSWETYRR